MEKYFLFICALFTLGSAQNEGALEVKFQDPSTRYVTVGATDIAFTCELNRGLMFIVENTVQFVRKPADEKLSEVQLSRSGQLMEGEPGFYEVKVREGVSVAINFTIKQVRDIDDGKLICRAKIVNSDEQAEASVDVVVVRPLSSLKLKFGSSPAVSQSTTTPVEVDSGLYTVSCIAEGSNPAPVDVHLLLEGNKVEHGDPIIAEYFEESVRKYRSTIRANVDLKTSDSMKKLECTASSRANDNHSVKLPIKIKVYDPIVVCNDTYAYMGKMYPVLKCVVDHTGLDVKSYKYELGSTGEVVAAGEQNDDFVQVDTVDISRTKTEVILNLYEAKDWHFGTDFVLLVELSDGHVSRETVKLIKTAGEETDNKEGEEGPGDSGASVKMSLAMVLFASLVASWLYYQ